MSITLNECSGDDAFAEHLLGRKVVSAEMGEYKSRIYTEPAAVLTLDDGTVLYVIPNQGGCLCSAGDYFVTAMNRVDNIITGVKVVEEIVDHKYEEDKRFIISVFAGDEQVNLVEMDGSDGNGYYGTGFTMVVTR